MSTNTVSLSEVAEQIGTLVDRALHGETIFIEVDSKLLILQEYPRIEPLPEGALKNVDTPEEIEQENLFAKRSVVTLDPTFDQ